PLYNGGCRPPPSVVSTYTSLSNCVCGVIDFDFANTIPRSTSCFSTPRSSNPTLSPACPSSRSLRNISTPVTTVFLSVPNPTISTSSPTFTFPRSIRPVATVPRPVIENPSPTRIRNRFSTPPFGRSEEHTSELQSPDQLLSRLLLVK